MQITINDVVIDIGSDIDYPQMNPTTGAYSDKVKYRLTQRDAQFAVAIKAIADAMGKIDEALKRLQSEYIWVSDDETIMAADDDTILMFSSDMQGLVADLQRRQDAAEADIAQLANQPVITYSNPS